MQLLHWQYSGDVLSNKTKLSILIKVQMSQTYATKSLVFSNLHTQLVKRWTTFAKLRKILNAHSSYLVTPK